MILFEVKETKDFDLLGPWSFHKNVVTIGGFQSQLSDIKINNEDFTQEVVRLRVEKELFFIEVIHHNTTVLLNGKKTMGKAPLSKESQLQVGHTLFEIKDFKYTEYNFGDKLSKNFKKIIRSNHPINKVIEKLEHYLREK